MNRADKPRLRRDVDGCWRWYSRKPKTYIGQPKEELQLGNIADAYCKEMTNTQYNKDLEECSALMGQPKLSLANYLTTPEKAHGAVLELRAMLAASIAQVERVRGVR